MPRLFKPYAQISIGGSSSSLSPIRAIRVTKRLSGGADELRFAMALNAGLSVAQDDDVSLDLGWDDEGETVFIGKIQTLDFSFTEVKVMAFGSQRDLIQARTDETFVDQNAGDVVQALASNAGIPLGTVDTGIRLAKYHADGSANVFEHLHELARLSGVDVFTDDEGNVNFTKREAFTPDFTYQFGINLMDARIRHGSPTVGAIEVVPESAASAEGDEASSWLVKASMDLSASAGDGTARRFSSALCTTKEAAETAAKAHQRDLQRRAVQGKLLVIGEPSARPGHIIELKDLPDDASNGVYEVSGVDHMLDAIRGFRTAIHLWGQA